MADRLEIVIGNRLEEIPSANERVGEWLRSHGTPARAVRFANLCIEEIVSNSVKYGYDDKEQHCITLSVELSADRLQVEICDDGREFDPLNSPEPDLSLSIDERPIGGMGLLMVRRMADGARYSRQAGVNRLLLWKSLS